MSGLKFLLLAGSYKQANHWRMDRGLTWQDCVYVSRHHDLRGRGAEDFELVRVGEWWRNPLIDSVELTAAFPNWQSSSIEDSPNSVLLGDWELQFPNVDTIQLNFNLLRYGKSRALREAMKAWCEQNGYTDLFYQELEWWAFPPNGVMPVQVAKVMGQERSPF